MRKYSFLLMMFVAPACSVERPELSACEQEIISTLKAPSSYKRIKWSATEMNPSHPENLLAPTEMWVTIEYDAVNAYNAPLRGHQLCRYQLSNGVANIAAPVDELNGFAPDDLSVNGSALDDASPPNSADGDNVEIGGPADDL